MQTVVNLAQKLISIPSYNDHLYNDSMMSEFIFCYLKKNFPYLSVIKQKVTKNRFNIIATDNFPAQLVFACHLDTTEPKVGGKYPSLEPTIIKNRLYGLGAKDMKGGIAALLSALKKFKKTCGLCLIFYIDEEYELLGMKKLVSKFKFRNFKPKLILAPESKFKIGNAHRGIVGINFKVLGQSAPAARPCLGKNAIFGGFNAIKFLEKKLSSRLFCHHQMGNPILNLAYLSGGVLREVKGKEILISKHLNNVPDVAEFGISCRTTTKKLKAKLILAYIKNYLKENGFKLLDYKIIHDFPPSYVSSAKLKVLEKIIIAEEKKVEYNDPKNSGFNDVQLLAEKYNVPFVNFGPKGARNHQSDEYVELESLKKTQKIFEKIIDYYCHRKTE